ncbi:hypothetical protein V8E54_012390 [Elaphomyces granulatus]
MGVSFFASFTFFPFFLTLIAAVNDTDCEESQSNSTLDFESISLDVIPSLQSSILAILDTLQKDYQSIQDAVKEINQLYPSTEDFFWILWVRLSRKSSETATIRYVFPHDIRITPTIFKFAAKYRVWQDLPALDARLRDDWYCSESPSPEEFRKWANLNSFAARLNREGLIEGDMYALYELCAALEGENAAERITYRNISVATASAMERVEKAMWKRDLDLFTGEIHRPFKSPRTAV